MYLVFNTNFDPIDDYFYGTVDGNGFKLINLSINEQKMKSGYLDNALVFRFIRNNFGIIKNIEVSNLNYKIETTRGKENLSFHCGFIGYNSSNGVIENIVINDNSNLNVSIVSNNQNTSARQLFGAVCGFIRKATFRDYSIYGCVICYNVEACVGGIIGDNRKWDENSNGILRHALVINNTISGTTSKVFGKKAITNVGGLVGVSSGENTNLVFLSNVFNYESNDENWCGQIIGREYSGEATNCLCCTKIANCWIIGNKELTNEFGKSNVRDVLVRIYENWDLSIWNVNLEEFIRI